MKYIAAADSDIGISKSVNQDSVCAITADTDSGKAAMIMICDGMGGLSKGELASAAAVRSFADWFENELPYLLSPLVWEDIAKAVIAQLRGVNDRLVEYGAREDIRLGTTVTGILAVGTKYMTFHVGDTRIYKISSRLSLLTDDHTFVNREIKRGNMTPEQAKTDPRRNALVQCVGVNGELAPDVKFGDIEDGANYMICSDGFRHKITDKEIYDALSPRIVTTKTAMQAKMRELIETVKERVERDNISAVMFRAEL